MEKIDRPIHGNRCSTAEDLETRALERIALDLVLTLRSSALLRLVTAARLFLSTRALPVASAGAAERRLLIDALEAWSRLPKYDRAVRLEVDTGHVDGDQPPLR